MLTAVTQMKYRLILAGLGPYLLIFAFSGCAIQQPVSDNKKIRDWDNNKLRLEQLQVWKLNGRIGIQLKKESGSASLSWEQNGQDYLIRIIAPFGRGTIELHGNSAGVTMRDANNQILQARHPETLLQAYLGWQVPLTGLNYWVRGIPDPESEIKTLVLDGNARIRQLSQGDWQVSYTSYMQKGQLSLPGKLALENQSLKVKLTIRQWDLSP